ncbi:flagellar filament capping protein FliD [Poriferisphaera sp. WC338]|uniref:flagellar filament capping protein FliD n=1 Tax=Poriferisphaera sp. WC338 TaxID=3425129 RepID=UPI003D81811E
MGQITSSVGLISGIDQKAIIDQLIAIESRPKQSIERNNAVLTSQKTAFQAINAQLLGVKSNADSLSTTTAFTQTTIASSNESVLTASSSVSAIPGSYSFVVNQLVASQQTVTSGFTDSTTALGLDTTFTVESGLARLDSKTQLANLNGGEGVQRGLIRITDRSGNSAFVDLSTAVEVNDVLDKINNTLGVNVIATHTDDGFQLTDNSGGTATNLIVENVGTGTTASSLGIVGSSATGTITGTAINTVGLSTKLATLNDGMGIQQKEGQPDFQIDTAAGNFTVDISGALTLEDVIDKINTAATDAGIAVTAAIGDDNVSLKLTDGGGGSAAFEVTELNDSKAASDLGILGADVDADGVIAGDRVISAINSKLLKNLNGGEGLAGAGGLGPPILLPNTPLSSLFNGTGITTSNSALYEFEIQDRNGDDYYIDIDGALTAQDLIDTINTATGGAVTLSIDGNAFKATDNTGSTTNNLRIRVPSGGQPAVNELGLNQDVAANEIVGVDTSPEALPNGESGPGTIRIRNRAGTTTDVDLSSARSVSQILNLINNSGAGITASLNQAGSGIELKDTSGGTGKVQITDVTGATATNLKISGEHDGDVIDSGSLEYQYVNESTRFESLGVSRGKFRITDSKGGSAVVDLTQGNEITIADVLSEINSRGLDINARVNDAGDGIVIEDTGGGALKMIIEEEGSSTAADLGILGETANPGEGIDGSFQKSIKVEATDSLEDILTKINDGNVGVKATIINDGSGSAPFRLSLTSTKEGSQGAFVFDDGGTDLGAFNLSEAQDAVVFYGAGNVADSLVITSSTNTVKDLVAGVTIDLKSTSQEAVQLTVGRDDNAITDAVKGFVDSFNSLVNTLDTYDSYNAETQERGLLLGDFAVSTVRTSMYNAILFGNNGLTGRYTSLNQIGITVGGKGQVQFDSAKLQTALETDREAVIDLFTYKKTEEDADGKEVIVESGIGVEINELLKSLTDGEGGAIQRRLDTIDSQIELNNKKIEDFDVRLAAKRARLESQFVAMEKALADMQSQSAALGQIQPLQLPNTSNN